MAPILFLVHGMGQHAPGWSKEIKDKLNSTAKRYPSFAGYLAQRNKTEFTDLVVCVEITYDDVLSDYVARLKSDMQQFSTTAGQVGMPGIFDWYQHHATPDEQAFFWSHCSDVFAYCCFGELRTATQVRVMKQIADVLGAGNGVRASVLSHSLGTAVAHDSLAELGTQGWDGQSGLSASGGFRFHSLYTVANVSHLLQKSDVYTSCVRPASAGAPCYCENFFDFHHDFDPITWAGRFTPPGAWGDGYVLEPHLHHFGRLNVHDFAHYLDHPAVHTTIINDVLEDVAISAPDIANGIANYKPELAAPCAASLDKFKTTIADLQARMTIHPDLATLVTAGSTFLAEAKAAGSACF